jgi:hypothetical protein
MSDLFASTAPRTFARTEAPTNSPWGQVDHTEEFAPGIWRVSTPGHGGFKLSPQRQRMMPDYMKRPGAWYEEDCEWSLVAVVFRDEFDKLRPWQIEQKVTETDYQHALKTARGWYPDEFERFFGVTLAPGESHVKDERNFLKEHANDFIVVAAWGAWAKFVPASMVGVCARRGGRGNPRGEEKWFLIPDAEYEKRHCGLHFLIDESRHQEIPAPSPDQQTPKKE